MRLLAVPNWSIFSPELIDKSGEMVSTRCRLHYAKGDVDHGRSVIGFSGDAETVLERMDALASLLLPTINLTIQPGKHPHSGALDVAPFVVLEGESTSALSVVRAWAQRFSEMNRIPVFLYEKSAEVGRESSLPALRGQLGKPLPPFDFGSVPHPVYGYTTCGVRDFLLAVNVNYPIDRLSDVKVMARMIREQRDRGDTTFTGVRSLSFELIQQKIAQLSMNLTAPNSTSFDEIYAHVSSQIGLPMGTELVGVIRRQDLARSTNLSVMEQQIVD